MKKLLQGSVALAALMVGPAMAADMPAAPVYKAAPPPPAVYSWTGCYVGAGGGYGMFDQEHYVETDPGHVRLTQNGDAGGRGWFGTVQVGCDYQFAGSWVVGAFADYDFASIKGTLAPIGLGFAGEEKMKSGWSAGGRVGWTPFDRLLTFVSAGYTQARFNSVDLLTVGVAPVTTGTSYLGHTYSGYFIGSGYEYALGWFPGLTWKTEYRFADYRADDVSRVVTATGALTGDAMNSHKYVQTVRSELVWRFGGGPVMARY
jgi:outer membrane immunogenic protein